MGDLLHLWGKNIGDDSGTNDRTNDSELMKRLRAVINTLDVAVCINNIGRYVIHDMLDVPLAWEVGLVKDGMKCVKTDVKSRPLATRIFGLNLLRGLEGQGIV